MTAICFATQPHTRRVAPPESTLLELTRAATDTDGLTWPAGTNLQPSSHGNYGYRYTVVPSR